MCNISGSKDGTLRAWSLNHGSAITVFDMHTPVAGLLLTPDANHMCVRLESSEHLPLMCFHNTPAGEVKSQSQISIELPGGEVLIQVLVEVEC